MTRPVQLGLIEGAPDKHVGRLLGSIVRGNNADLIAHLAPLYLTGSVLDTTYGQGKWWRRFRPADLVTHDIAQDGVDFRQLPYEPASFDTVCFDPPYTDYAQFARKSRHCSACGHTWLEHGHHGCFHVGCGCGRD